MKRHCYYLLLLSFSLIACEEEVNNIEFNKPGYKIIIDGLITDIKGYSYIKVYKTEDYYSKIGPDSISNAYVTITDNKNNPARFIEKPGEKGSYYNDSFQCVPGAVYHLVLSYNNIMYESAAEMILDTLPFYIYSYPVHFQKIFIGYSNDTIHFRYLFYLNDTLKSSIDWLWVTPMENYGGNAFDLSYPFRLNDKILIERQSLTYESYMYYKNITKYMLTGDGPFINPVNMPAGNISNGALGIFRASSIMRQSAVIDRVY